ncbi:MAG: aspartate-semialdehyde dehydrogenase [Puniceicoccales bacterium]|jgi:aspartate-semialdehyde dehydrogenase|nr:aspartate-semialdehyde dehydrogenase [Puniceicoccales bacterium]
MDNVAIIGVTGVTGQAFMEIYREKTGCIPTLYGSQRSAGKVIVHRGKTMEILPFEESQLQGYDFLFLFSGDAFSTQWAKQLSQQNNCTIDCSGAWRLKKNVPMIIPHINGIALRKCSSKLLCMPNCSTTILLTSLWPLHCAFGLKKFSACTYQSVSGNGKAGMDTLCHELTLPYPLSTAIAASPYDYPIAHNIIPAIGDLHSDGHCAEEISIARESRKVLGLSELHCDICCARVPIHRGHSMFVSGFFGKKISVESARKIWEHDEHIALRSPYLPTPLGCLGEFRCHIGRLRLSKLHKNGITYWVSADQLICATALNAFRIMEMHCRSF